MVKANVDRILDILRQKNSTSISELSQSLGLKKEDIQKSAEYLEQDGKIKIEHKWPKVVLTLNPESNLEDQELQPPPLNQPPQVQNYQQQLQQPRQVQTPPQQPQSIQQPITQQPTQPMPQLKPKEPLPVPPMQNPLQPQQSQPIQQQPQIQKPAQQPLKPIQPMAIPPINNQVPKNPVQSPQITKPINNNPNPIFSNTIANHPELPPPPRPKHRTTVQQENINYADKPMSEIFKSTQQDSFQPFQNKNLNDEIPRAEDFKPENDPLDPDTPTFNLDIPSPDGKETTPVFIESDNFSSKKIELPSNIKDDMEKIEFLIDQLKTKLNNRDYKDLNNFYRRLYMIYTDSEDMSSNEKYLLSEKINDIFERIKHVYTIEEVI